MAGGRPPASAPAASSQRGSFMLQGREKAAAKFIACVKELNVSENSAEAVATEIVRVGNNQGARKVV